MSFDVRHRGRWWRGLSLCLLAGLAGLAAQAQPGNPAPTGPVIGPVGPQPSSAASNPPTADGAGPASAFVIGPNLPPPSAEAQQRGLSDWLLRMREASGRRSYVGTFVVSSGMGDMTASRIWHVCTGDQQYERVDALNGTPRITLRRNNDVLIMLPTVKLARSEKQESFGLFPNLVKTGNSALAEFYSAQAVGSDRSAGFDTDVVLIEPKDTLRFGYRMWSEKKTGLVIRLQTLDTGGQVVEQSGFTELQLDVPLRADKLALMMSRTEGYRIEHSEVQKTTAVAEGWALKQAVPGFHAISCFKRILNDASPAQSSNILQWAFSDGLAAVSMFLEKIDPKRQIAEGLRARGATHSLTQRLHEKDGDWLLTLVGEVPSQTLQAFARNLERKTP